MNRVPENAFDAAPYTYLNQDHASNLVIQTECGPWSRDRAKIGSIPHTIRIIDTQTDSNLETTL